MKMLALERFRQLNDRAHDGEPRVNNAHGDRREKNCLNLPVIETRHRGCGEDNKKHQEWDASRLDVEPNAHRTVDDKPQDQGEESASPKRSDRKRRVCAGKCSIEWMTVFDV